MDRDCSFDPCQSCPAKLVCRCLKVTEEQLIQAITHHDLQTLQELRQRTGAGDGCTCCHAKLKFYLAKFQCASAVAG